MTTPLTLWRRSLRFWNPRKAASTRNWPVRSCQMRVLSVGGGPTRHPSQNKVERLFNATHVAQWMTGEGWYRHWILTQKICQGVTSALRQTRGRCARTVVISSLLPFEQPISSLSPASQPSPCPDVSCRRRPRLQHVWRLPWLAPSSPPLPLPLLLSDASPPQPLPGLQLLAQPRALLLVPCGRRRPQQTDSAARNRLSTCIGTG